MVTVLLTVARKLNLPGQGLYLQQLEEGTLCACATAVPGKHCKASCTVVPELHCRC